MLVKKIYELYDKEERYPDRNIFFVSEVDKCPIAIFYSFKKKPKAKLGAQTHLRFSDGDDTHKRLVRALFSIGIVGAVEIPIPENELFGGRADAIVAIKNELYVVEIKAVGSYKFKKLLEADPSYIKQLQLYLYYLNIDKGIILIENKDTQELKEFVVKKDVKMIKQILGDFTALKRKILNDELPGKPKVLAKWKCIYCSYRKMCGNDM